MMRRSQWLVALAVVAVAACADRPTFPLRQADGSRPNVLLITVDTLRADHLGAYGYANRTSPVIDRLAREGVLFSNTFTPVPTTAPAVASLVTGLHLARHRVSENGATLPDELRTLGEMFAEAGYRTAGLFGNGAIANGFGQGLELWEPFAPDFGVSDRTGMARARSWIEGATEPWFLWVHCMDPHGPYDSSPPDVSAALEYPEDARMNRALPLAAVNYGYDVIPRYQALADLRRVVDYVRRYDGEIIGTDRALGELVRALEQGGALARTLIVLTADHGESLGENGYFFQHGRELNEASLRVPLVLWHPALPAGRRIDAPASLVDLLPTLATLVGLGASEGGVGQDLTPLLSGGSGGERTIVAYTVTPNRLTAVRRGPWKLVGEPAPDAAPPDRFLRMGLFEAQATGDHEVSMETRTDIVASLSGALRASAALVRGHGGRAPALTPEEQRRLRALGYLD